MVNVVGDYGSENVVMWWEWAGVGVESVLCVGGGCGGGVVATMVITEQYIPRMMDFEVPGQEDVTSYPLCGGEWVISRDG